LFVPAFISGICSIMKKIVLGVFAVGACLVLILLVGGCNSYNRLVSLSQNVDSQWAQVQSQYQRRMDLIPNLVSTVSGAANFEKSTLTEITAARASVGQIKVDPNQAPNDPAVLAQFQKTQDQLSSALSRLLVVVERYPDLKATTNFRDLQAQLEGTENRIATERMRFNEAVQRYNVAVKRFPTVLFAGMLGFQPKPYFQSSAGAETPPKVEFNFGQPAAQPNR
jgi:LemA protein